MARVVVGSLVVAAIVVASLAMMNKSDSEVVRADVTVAPTSLSPRPANTTTTYVALGGISILSSRAEESARLLELDFSHLTAGSCFNVVHEADRDPEPVPIDCAEPHYYQLYAVGVLPTGVIDSSALDDLARNYCHEAFLRFVDVWWYLDSRFAYSWNPPEESEYPENRANYCFLDVPGDYAWTGNAEGSGA